MKFVLFRFANNLWKANKRAYPENVRKHWIEIKEDKSLELFAVCTKVRRRTTDVCKYFNLRNKYLFFYYPKREQLVCLLM
jgi:hypothetical protein